MPIITYESLPVQIYIITKKMPKKSKALPRSFSKITISNAKTHIKSNGKSVRKSGIFKPKNPRRVVESISRLSARYAARNTTMNIFAISPG